MNAIPIAIDSRIRIPIALLSTAAIDALKSEFTHDNPDYARENRLADARGWKRKSGLPYPTIETWTEEGGDTSWSQRSGRDSEHPIEIEPLQITLPRGRFARVREILTEHGYAYEVSDRRTEGDPKLRHEGRYKLAPHIVPFKFQVEAHDAAIATQNCIVRAPTASGKTVVAEMIAATLGLPTLVLVQTDKLYKQWVRRLHDELGVPKGEIGEIRGKKHKVCPITVASIQTFEKHAKRHKKTFGVVVFDEVQRAAADTFYPGVNELDAKYRIGISADERRKDRKDFLVYDLFGRVAFEIDRKILIRDRFIFDTEVRLVQTDHAAPWYVKLPPQKRQLNEVFGRLLEGMKKDEKRNELIVKLATEQMKAGHVSLIFSHRVEHCFDLRSRIVERDHRAGIIVGETKYRQESDESLRDLTEGKIVTAIGTVQSIGTGIDLPAVDRGIATTPMHSNRQQAGQMRGRLCRVDRSPNARKTDSILYVLWDRKVHGLVPLRQWLRINDGNVTIYDHETGKTEPGRAFLKKAEREEAETI